MYGWIPSRTPAGCQAGRQLDAEAEQLCNAKRYERTAERTNARAGHYKRKLHTKAGEVELKVPKLRYAKFETEIINRYRRKESSVEEALMEMYLAGVSVRRVEDITEALWGMKEVAAMLKAIHAQEDFVEAQKKAQAVADKLDQMKLRKASEKVRDGACETLSYYHFPREHWRQIRTNNPLERIMREIRRRLRVVGCFPDGNSALMLAAARLRYIAGTKWGSRRCLNMKRLQELETERTVLSDKKSTCPSGQVVA